MKAAVLYETDTHLKIEEFDLPAPKREPGAGAIGRQWCLSLRLARR